MLQRTMGNHTLFSPSNRLAILLVPLVLLLGVSAGGADEIPVIDAHSQVDQYIDFDEILKLMDEAGVSRTILALRGQRRPGDLVSFAARHPDRITPAIRTKGKPYMKGLKQFKRFLKKQLRIPEFEAMAEVLMWHAKKDRAPDVTLGPGKKGKPPQVVVHPDDERVQVALRAAIQRKWPFIAHIEFAAAGADRDVFMTKFENLLRQHTDHPFVLIHMGELEAKDVRRLIDGHGNIFFITAMSNPIVVERSDQPLVNMFEGSSLAPRWKELIVRHPDRFILGFDNVFAGHWRKLYLKQVALWRKALEELPHEVAHAVAHRNAERLWRLPAAR